MNADQTCAVEGGVVVATGVKRPRSAWMNRGIAVGLILLGLALFLRTAVEEVTRAGVYPARQTVQLGTVSARKDVNATARIWNMSPRTIKIHELSQECGCTEAEPETEVLRPFSSTTIRMVLDTSQQSGAFSKRVFVEVTPMAPQPAEIRLQATVAR